MSDTLIIILTIFWVVVLFLFGRFLILPVISLAIIAGIVYFCFKEGVPQLLIYIFIIPVVPFVLKIINKIFFEPAALASITTEQLREKIRKLQKKIDKYATNITENHRVPELIKEQERLLNELNSRIERQRYT